MNCLSLVSTQPIIMITSQSREGFQCSYHEKFQKVIILDDNQRFTSFPNGEDRTLITEYELAFKQKGYIPTAMDE